MGLFHKAPKYTMNNFDASSTLQNVFDACDKPASTHIDELIVEASVVASGIRPRIIVSFAILIFTLLLPLFFSPFLHKSSKNVRPNVADITVTDYLVDDDTLEMTFEGAFLNLRSVYATDSAGNIYYPSKYDLWNDRVVFEYNNTEWNVFVDDTYGNSLHMLLTPTNN